MNWREVLDPTRRSEGMAGDRPSPLGLRAVPHRTHAHRMREKWRIERMAKAVHCIHAEQDRDVQPRILHGERLNSIVRRRPIPTVPKTIAV